jgi:hypothetical protein
MGWKWTSMERGLVAKSLLPTWELTMPLPHKTAIKLSVQRM